MEKSRWKFLKILGSVFIVAIVAGALVASPSATMAQTKSSVKPLEGVPSTPVKIGLITVRSGSVSLLGVPGLRGAEIWQEMTNASGGILGRKVEYCVEEETSPRETVEKFRKLTLKDNVDVIVGVISTGVSLAVGPVAEEMEQVWLSWDGTTQKGVEETVLNPKYAFRAIDNESASVGGGIMAAQYFPNVKTIAGINSDYSYGRDTWETFTSVLRQFNPNFKIVAELWPKLGETEFTSHIATIKRANPDLLVSSFFGGENAAFFKQASAVDLFKDMKGAFTNAGASINSLKKDFTPEGLLIGFDVFYFENVKTWPLGKKVVKRYMEKYNEAPGSEIDNAFFTLQAYKAAVEKLYAITGRWPKKEEIVKILPGILVQSVSGYRGYTTDNRMMAEAVMGITTHNNPYDFVTAENVRSFPGSQAFKPKGWKLHDWINTWK